MKWIFLEINLPQIYHKWIASCLAMTQSDDKGVVLWRCKGWRILVRHEGLEWECVVKNESENNGHRVRERQRPTGVGGEAWPPGGEALARDG